MIGGSPGQIWRETISKELRIAYEGSSFKSDVIKMCRKYDSNTIGFIKFKMRMRYKEHKDWFNRILVLL